MEQSRFELYKSFIDKEKKGDVRLWTRDGIIGEEVSLLGPVDSTIPDKLILELEDISVSVI